MTDRFDPRSPLPHNPSYADSAADFARADDPDADGAPDARRDDLPGLGSDWIGALLHDDDAASVDDPSADTRSPTNSPDAPSPATDSLDPRALAALMEAHSPRAMLARLPPLPTLTSSTRGHRPGRRAWSPARRVAFLQMLSASQSVVAAARSVGMSRSGAYNLRGRIPKSAFVRAWDMAFAHGYDALAHAALDRALNGIEVPHYYKGELVGTSRRYDERLTLGLMGMRGEIVHGATGRAPPEDGEWELLLHAVVQEAEDEIEALTAPTDGAKDSEEGEA